MTRKIKYTSVLLVSSAFLTAALMSSPVRAASDQDELRQRVATMEQMLGDLKQRLEKSESIAKDAQQKAVKAENKAIVAEKLANADENASVNWHFSGYATANYKQTDQTNTVSSFGSGKFNPLFLVGYKDLLTFQGELEVSTNSDASTKVSLEYATLDLMATDYATISMGKFLSPIGAFQSRLHPAWINKMPDRPAGFVEDGGAEPLSEIGASVHGGVELGSMLASYNFFVGNGPRLSDEGINMEGFGSDVNGNKAFGGRLGLRPVPYFEIGISGMHSRMNGVRPTSGTDVTDANFNLIDVDAAFTKGPWDIRGEFISSKLGKMTSAFDSGDTSATSIPEMSWQAWYAQAAYRISGLTDHAILGNFEPVVRYGHFSVSGDVPDWKTLEEDRVSVGLNYWFAPSIVMKASYSDRDFKNQADANEFNVQFAYGF